MKLTLANDEGVVLCSWLVVSHGLLSDHVEVQETIEMHLDVIELDADGKPIDEDGGAS
jgi:hypothetical protein